MKTCTKCNETKPISEFRRKKGNNPGYGVYYYHTSRCQSCLNAESRVYYNSNKEKWNSPAMKQYRIDNAEKIREWKTNWAKNNPLKRKEAMTRWNAKEASRRDKKKHAERVKLEQRKVTQSLGERYIKQLLARAGFPDIMVQNKQFIQLKRKLLLQKRQIKQNEKEVQETKKSK